MTDEDHEFSRVEQESRIRKEYIANMTGGWRKRQVESMAGLDPYRNQVLEEVALQFDMMPALGDTAASFAAFVRGMKR
jgi:hypothetical protein